AAPRAPRAEKRLVAARQVFVLGPPAAGKTTIAMWLCKHLNASYLSQQKLLSNKTLVLAKEAQSYQQRQEQIPDELWVDLLQDRLSDMDCIREGWVLDGFPQTHRAHSWPRVVRGGSPLQCDSPSRGSTLSRG
uniref:Uncharacterized protein n=1 Tax=Terrapene triunguis TaxID=2587831 RepID=A0A674JAY0_9SAUR